MAAYSTVVASRLAKYRQQMERDGNDADLDTAILKYVICQLVDASFAGGGGGGGSTSVATITQGINDAVDIDSIVLALNQIATNSGYPVGARTIAQSQSVSIASDQRVAIDNQQINGTAIATGVGTANGGTQRVALSVDSKVSGYGYESKATITRPANTTAYIANSVYGGAFELTNIGADGGHIILSGVRVIFSNTTLPSGMAGFTLFLYTGTPPSAVADGGSFSIPVGDRASLLTPGGIDLSSAVAAIGGGSVVLQTDNLNIQLKLADGVSSVWGYLVNRSAHTPVSGSTAAIAALALGV